MPAKSKPKNVVPIDFAQPPPRLVQPLSLRTKDYIYGVQKLNGFDAWSLFEASAAGDLVKVKELLSKDPHLVNAQYWYQFPIHTAVAAGHTKIVKLLLDSGANPGESRHTYSSWPKLLATAQERGYKQIENLLVKAMQERFNYDPEFDLLSDGIIASDGPAMKALLERRPELLQASDSLGNNVLHWTVITRRIDLLGFFEDLGAPLNAERADGQTPILLAANGALDYWHRDPRDPSHRSMRNTWALVGFLLAKGALYTMSVAAALGDPHQALRLLAADPACARRLDSSRRAPLTYAAREGHLGMVEFLLDHGADPNLPEESAPRGAALFSASAGNHLDVAKLLLERGADPNGSMDSSGNCVTICEVCHGEQGWLMQDLLIRHGGRVPPYAHSARQLKFAIQTRSATMRDPEFAVSVVRAENAALIKLALQKDPTILDRIEPMDYPRSPAVARVVLAAGWDPNLTDWIGRTPLHYCAVSGDRRIASILLKAGANINARDMEGQATPLALAVRSWHSDDDDDVALCRLRMVELLLKNGAALNLPGDPPWATPLAWARQNGLEEVERLLLKHGAT